jgi:hypothetical protein
MSFFRISVVAALTALSALASAQERIADLDNSIRVEYQYARASDYRTEDGTAVPVGDNDTHVLLLSGVWSVTEKWKLYASLPYVQKRHEAGTFGVHDWRVDFVEYTPPDLRIVDDGNYHGGFQDITVGVQYLALDGPAFRLSPFVSYGVPTTDYPIYGAAIRGRGLNELHFGVSMQYLPYFSDWLFDAEIAYAISERVLGVDLNYWRTYLSAGYYLTPRFVPRVFLITRNAPNADEYFEDIVPYYDSEIGWRHDQTLQHNFINGGLGFDYIVNDRYTLSATYYQTIEAEDLFELDYGVSFGLTRQF